MRSRAAQTLRPLLDGQGRLKLDTLEAGSDRSRCFGRVPSQGIFASGEAITDDIQSEPLRGVQRSLFAVAVDDDPRDLRDLRDPSAVVFAVDLDSQVKRLPDHGLTHAKTVPRADLLVKIALAAASD